MCKILHIETATEVCSVSIALKGKVIAYKETTKERSHAAVLSVFIRELFDKTGLSAGDLDAIAVSMGPGSYTGLRIGVSTAKGLCYGADLPLIAIPTLEIMCFGMLEKFKGEGTYLEDDLLFLPMIDARRMEVYTAIFNKDLAPVRDTSALIIESTSFDDLLQNNRLVFFGDGADKLSDTIVNPNACFFMNYKLSSVHMTELAYARFKNKDFVDVAYFEPYYLKDFITTTPKKKLL